MRKIIYVLLLLLSTTSIAQNIKIKDVEAEINSATEKYIDIRIVLDIQKEFPGFKINKLDFKKTPFNLYIGKSIYKFDKIVPGNYAFNFKMPLTKENEEILLSINNESLSHYIQVNNDIIFKIKKEGEQEKEFTLSKDEIKKESLNSFFKLSDAEKDEIIKSKGGEALIAENSIDLGHISASESNSGNAEVTISFKYRDYWKNSNLGYSFEGIVSTDAKDSLNYISAFPLITSLRGNDGNIRNFDIIGKIGIEGNQTFTSYRISADLSIQGIIPNLIDLTGGENRLRLKPVVNFGLKFYNEVENNRRINTDNEVSNQIFTDFYYYIPIHKTFSLTLNGKAFYDVNKRVNPDRKINYNFDAVLGFIAVKGFKTIFKYTRGDNNVTFERGDFFSIGVLSDVLSGINK